MNNISAIKAAIRDRDGQRCVRCGMTAQDHVSRHGKTLEVHREVPKSEYAMEGCVTLCLKCHDQRHREMKAGGVTAAGDISGFLANRLEFELTQAFVGRQLGISSSRIADIEARRRKPSPQWLLWAVAKLGWAPESIFTDAEFLGFGKQLDRIAMRFNHGDSVFRPATFADATRLRRLGLTAESYPAADLGPIAVKADEARIGLFLMINPGGVGGTGAP